MEWEGDNKKLSEQNLKSLNQSLNSVLEFGNKEESLNRKGVLNKCNSAQFHPDEIFVHKIGASRLMKKAEEEKPWALMFRRTGFKKVTNQKVMCSAVCQQDTDGHFFPNWV